MLEIVLVWIASGVIGASLLGQYDRAGTGFLLGAILGPIGVIVAFVVRRSEQSKRRKCPHCAEVVLIEARVCKHCGRDIEAAVS